MVSTEAPKTLGLTVETRTRRLFRRTESKVERIVLAEGDRYEIDRHELMSALLYASGVPESSMVTSIVLLPEGPIKRTEFQGTEEEPVDTPLIRGEIDVVRKSVLQTVTITG